MSWLITLQKHGQVVSCLARLRIGELVYEIPESIDHSIVMSYYRIKNVDFIKYNFTKRFKNSKWPIKTKFFRGKIIATETSREIEERDTYWLEQEQLFLNQWLTHYLINFHRWSISIWNAEVKIYE